MKLPDDDLKRSKHVGVVLYILKCFKWKLYRCICWLIFVVILRNARSNDEIHILWSLRFSGTLNSVDWWLVTDVSVQRIGPIFNS